MAAPRARTRAGSRLTVVMLGGLVVALVIGARPATESGGQPLPLATALRRAAAGLTGPAGPLARFRQLLEPDKWARLVDTGDARRAGGGQPGPHAMGLTARTAYLLAFHHAQDAADTRRMLVAADRLEAAGEPELAHHLRTAARGERPGAMPTRRSAR
jgi:hypothetical protein